ncbi:hypothetical protein CL648_03315 [bacterium]|nr:hypothetical protein [bacterium]
MVYQSYLWILGFSVISLACFAESLSLDTYLKYVDATSPYLQRSHYLMAQYDAKAESARRKQAWLLSGDAHWTRESPSPANRLFESPSPRTQTGISTQLSKPIWATGGQVSVTHSLHKFEQKSSPLSLLGSQQSMQPNPLYRRSFGLSYRHPLMQNTTGTQSKLDYELAKSTIKYHRILRAETDESFRLNQYNNYLIWAHYYAKALIINDRLMLATALYADNQAKYSNNLIEGLELLQSKHYLNQQKMGNSQAKLMLKSHQSQLASALNYPAILTSTPNLNLYKIPNLNTAPMTHSWRVIETLVAQKNTNQLLQNALSDQQKPKLDIVINADWHDRLNAQNRVSDYGLMDKQVMLEFSTPLGRQSIRAELDALSHEAHGIQQTINHELNQQIAHKNQLESDYQRLRMHYNLQTTAVDLHRQMVNEEQRLYEQGRRSLTFVLQSQDAEHVAKLAVLETAVHLHRIVAEHNALLDRLP